MNLIQLLLYLVLFVTYTKAYKKGFITVKCKNYYEQDDRCKPGYDKNETTFECIFTMCDNVCNNGECDFNFCQEINTHDIINNDMVSDCKHFRASNNCNNCYCFKDGTCFCKTGYAINPKDQSKCEPYCSQQCENGFCSAPETCDCDPGFEPSLNKYKCVPRCSPLCVNSICNKNRVCECNHGFELRNLMCVPKESDTPRLCAQGYELRNNRCKPVCEQECTGGRKCHAPNSCICPNNNKFNNITGKCECVECKNDLLENNVCMCHNGYQTDPKNPCHCKSKCSTPCYNGYCSVHGNCTCDTNYEWNETTSKCEKKHKCFNGNWEGGKCLCKKEYKLDRDNEHLCISKCSPQCYNGYCSEFGNCTCHEGYFPNPHEKNECIPNIFKVIRQQCK